MTRKTADEPERPALLNMGREEAAKKLQAQIETGTLLFERDVTSSTQLQDWRDETSMWSDFNEELLRQMFDNPRLVNDYKQSPGGYSLIRGMPPTLMEKVARTKGDIRSYITNLNSVLIRLPLIGSAATAEVPAIRSVTRKVFVVHGHDTELRLEVEKTLRQLRLEPIVLADRTSQGRTIIEKFEHYADVWYAVVLLTPDDMGFRKDHPEEQKPRARQNAILELGYFIGRLGRERVCALHKGHVELPGDFDGVVYISADTGAWKLDFAREIADAGERDGVEVNLDTLRQ